MYYLIETDNAPTEMSIETQPGRGNMRPCPIITDGWLGTTNNVYRAAHGEFETMEQAENAAAAMGYTAERELTYDEEIEEVVAVYRTIAGARVQWEAGDWLDGSDPLPITADTTDSELDTIASDLETIANGNAQTLLGLDRHLHNLRDTKRDEQNA